MIISGHAYSYKGATVFVIQTNVSRNADKQVDESKSRAEASRDLANHTNPFWVSFSELAPADAFII